MKPNDVIRHFGTQVLTARALGMTQGSVSLWVRRGVVPYRRQLQIEQVTGGQLRANPADLQRELSPVARAPVYASAAA